MYVLALRRQAFLDDHSFSTQAMCVEEVEGRGPRPTAYYQMTRAGPRETLHFDPCDPAACALIVSCGGICPGLNSVIREARARRRINLGSIPDLPWADP